MSEQPFDRKQIIEFELDAIKYLLVSNAAGLITCITLVKDYKDNPNLHGIGTFVVLFGFGLVAGGFAYMFAMMERMYVGVDASELKRFSSWGAYTFIASAVLLLLALLTAIWKFARL
jgi:hypothetical protein